MPLHISSFKPILATACYTCPTLCFKVRRGMLGEAASDWLTLQLAILYSKADRTLAHAQSLGKKTWRQNTPPPFCYSISSSTPSFRFSVILYFSSFLSSFLVLPSRFFLYTFCFFLFFIPFFIFFFPSSVFLLPPPSLLFPLPSSFSQLSSFFFLLPSFFSLYSNYLLHSSFTITFSFSSSFFLLLVLSSLFLIPHSLFLIIPYFFFLPYSFLLFTFLISYSSSHFYKNSWVMQRNSPYRRRFIPQWCHSL